MKSLRKLTLLVILGLATICGATGMVPSVPDAPILVADSPMPPPPIPFAV